MEQNLNVVHPNRIQSIDVLRGIALLGLPTMNIIHFSMPQAAYMNPYVYQADAFMNHFIFSFLNLFADQKFMGLFTLLFGASLILLRDKNISNGADSSLIHYSRMFVLLLLGLFHFWFIWSGDILMFYAVIGIMLYPLAQLSPKALFWISGVFLALTLYCVHIPNITPQALGEDGFADVSEFYAPSDAFIESHGKLMLGTYSQTMSVHRAEEELPPESTTQSEEELAQSFKAMWVFVSFGLFIFCKMICMITLGMALYKTGVVQGNRTLSFYKTLAFIGISIGGIVTISGLVYNYQRAWDIQSFFSYGMLLKEFGSVLMTLGYVGLFIYLLQKGILSLAGQFIARVGQMALTNYLSQSIICALLFYGIGLGLYGSVSRLELIPIIIGIWIVQIVFSVVWLNHFVQGPVEWLWRSTSSLKLQPLLRKPNSI